MSISFYYDYLCKTEPQILLALKLRLQIEKCAVSIRQLKVS